MARVESGKETLHEEPWNISNLRDTVDVLLDNEIHRKHLEIHKDFQIVHPYVICDAMKIREIVMNLLSNAVKYTPDGGTISLHMDEFPSDLDGYLVLRIVVKDSGIGIGQEYLPHLFEAFSRERNSSESGIIGSGLGLKIVKSFVELMNGRITVDSELGKGTCFTVTLPLRIAPNQHPIASESLSQIPSDNLTGIRILLAEDNALNA